jgi:hypothetical protein
VSDVREARNLKSNVLPFPSLQAAPRDPPRPSAWRSLASLVVFLACMALLGLTLWALFDV